MESFSLVCMRFNSLRWFHGYLDCCPGWYEILSTSRDEISSLKLELYFSLFHRSVIKTLDCSVETLVLECHQCVAITFLITPDEDTRLLKMTHAETYNLSFMNPPLGLNPREISSLQVNILPNHPGFGSINDSYTSGCDIIINFSSLYCIACIKIVLFVKNFLYCT